MGGGYGYTGLGIYLIPANHTLKMVKILNFKLCIFNHNTSIKKKENYK